MYVGGVLRRIVHSRILLFSLTLLAIVLVIPLGIMKHQEGILGDKYKKVNGDLSLLNGLISQYKSKQGDYPILLEDMVKAGLVAELPVDPFSKSNESYKYLNLNNGAIVRVYSVGRDGTDNHSIIDIVRIVHEETYYDGKSSGFYENLQIAWIKDDPQNGVSDIMQAMLKCDIASADPVFTKLDYIIQYGWDDAFNYFKTGSDCINKIRASSPQTRFDSIHNPIPGIPPVFSDASYYDGIDDPDDLLELFSGNETSFALIHAGAGKPRRNPVMPEQDICFTTPQPDFLRALCLAKTIICHGKWMEKNGDARQAIEDYLDVLPLGQVIGASHNRVIGALMNVAVESVAYEALIDLILRTELDDGLLLDLITRIDNLEKSAPVLRHSFHCEGIWTTSAIESLYIPEAGNDLSLLNFLLKCNPQYRRARRSSTAYRKNADEYLRLPYPVSSVQDSTSTLDRLAEGIPIAVPDVSKVKVRIYGGMSFPEAARVILGLRHFRALNGVYPDSLDAIANLYKTPPVDPFTAKPFVYEKSDDGFRLYSLGPELVDDKAAIEYDPTNGTISAGDIIFTSKM